MGFSTAISGLNAASNLLSTTGNNIANANTTGFKRSRSEFADVYASGLGGVSKSTPGAGVVIANVAQQFDQGNLELTGNGLDLAISGEGFFALGDSTINPQQKVYTRAGMFHADEEGYIVNNSGEALLAYRPNGNTVAEGFSTGIMQTLQVDSSQGQPQPTTKISTGVNLDASKQAPTLSFVGPSGGVVDPNTYTHTSSVTVYDSLGNPHVASKYFVKTANPMEWDIYTYVDGRDIKGSVPPASPIADKLTFDNVGKLISPVNGQFIYPPITVAPNAQDLAITLDLNGSTQLGSPFSVNSLSQDGLPTGRLSGLDIDDTGIVFARFTNGASKPLGQVALVRFQNSQGLSKLGDTAWGENTDSGPPISGVAKTGSFGTIKAGALESSNVDLAAQLVTLIVAQQAYQANAQTITTENQVVQTLLNVR